MQSLNGGADIVGLRAIAYRILILDVGRNDTRSRSGGPKNTDEPWPQLLICRLLTLIKSLYNPDIVPLYGVLTMAQMYFAECWMRQRQFTALNFQR